MRMKTSPEALRNLFRTLRQQRRDLKARTKQAATRRGVLAKAERNAVLRKTNKRYHICGGLIKGKWQADHVLAHSGGGKHEVDNYLPAHTLCNNYRWDYLAEEFQYVLKLGVWAKTQIETSTGLGPELAKRFAAYEKRRRSRRIKRRRVKHT
jgi:5-methylcytosine-specific restriction endonuclease McrA